MIIKLILYFLIFIFLITNLFSQSFDWQWDARLPFKNPNNYIGISAKYGLEQLNGNISFLEDKIQCEDFVNAKGNNLMLGVVYEHWGHNNRICYTTQIFYSNTSLSSNNIAFVPLSPTLTAEYETILAISSTYLGASFGAKYRIPTTHIKVGAAIILSTLINNSYSVTEEILGPAEVPPFSTNPPSYKRDVMNGTINDLNFIAIMPSITLGYDLQLGLGIYFEPQLSLGYQLNNKFKQTTTNNWNFNAGINVYIGI